MRINLNSYRIPGPRLERKRQSPATARLRTTATRIAVGNFNAAIMGHDCWRKQGGRGLAQRRRLVLTGGCWRNREASGAKEFAMVASLKKPW